jgi:hypothetical protein
MERRKKKARKKCRSPLDKRLTWLAVLLKSTSAEKRANIASLASQIHRLHVYSKRRCKGRFGDCKVWIIRRVLFGS